MLRELGANAAISEPCLAGVDARLDEALDREEAICLEPIEQSLDLGLPAVAAVTVTVTVTVTDIGTGTGNGLAVSLRASLGRGMAEQLRAQLDAALVALRQQLQRPAFQRQALLHHQPQAQRPPGRPKGVADPSGASEWSERGGSTQSLTTLSLAGSPVACAPGRSGMPIASRTLFSISIARSGFSFRKSRALSLPWPIFSPL